MNQQDNIDKFFQKRLRDDVPANADWNMPSDDLWDQAKVHFPKEKNKRRIIPWFWVGGISFIAIALIAYLNFGKKTDDLNQHKPTIVLEENNIKSEENNLEISESKTNEVKHNEDLTLESTSNLIQNGSQEDVAKNNDVQNLKKSIIEIKSIDNFAAVQESKKQNQQELPIEIENTKLIKNPTSKINIGNIHTISNKETTEKKLESAIPPIKLNEDLLIERSFLKVDPVALLNPKPIYVEEKNIAFKNML